MDHYQIGWGSGFVYTLFFECPDCKASITFHDYTNSQKTEAELRANAYPAAACAKCNFKGGLHGSAIIRCVEFE
jgi:hypothetical protein